MKGDYNKAGFETRAIHAGQPADPQTGAVSVPIYQTSTYAQEEVGKHKGYEYSRTHNPTRTALELCVASLEGGENAHALAFASGLGAETTLLLSLRSGDHVLLSDDVYGGTYRLFARVLSQHGIQFDLADLTDLERAAGKMRSATKLVWLETPTNPWLKVIDIASVAEMAHNAGSLLVVDNTFASPYLQRPLEFGADVVLHSSTKYLGGHSDAVGGLLVMHDKELRDRIAFFQNAAGAVPGPFDSWLIMRGIKTLPIRMRAHQENALAIGHFLEQHPKVEQVMYPGLPSHPQHELAKRQMDGFGGMLSFSAKGGEAEARAIVARTKIFTLAESLGGVESLIEHPGAMTHASLAGSPIEMNPALVRLSVGIESTEDLLSDLEQALG
ncbi:cystathionine gamma-synthase [Candidatus Chlorohelix sp.]|uniref:cystathionine gamma-synthase n=1 Tax=Candidatus Chlorohelix sp. TaxID=3139201 RepID=UPI003021BFAC